LIEEVYIQILRDFKNIDQLNLNNCYELGVASSMLLHLFKFVDNPLSNDDIDFSKPSLEKLMEFSKNHQGFSYANKILIDLVQGVLSNPFSSQNTYSFFKGYLSVYCCRVLEDVGNMFSFFSTHRAIIFSQSKLAKEVTKRNNLIKSYIFDAGTEFVISSLDLVVKILSEDLLNRISYYSDELKLKKQEIIVKKIKKSKIFREILVSEYISSSCYKKHSESVEEILEQIDKINAKIDSLEDEYDEFQDDELLELIEDQDRKILKLKQKLSVRFKLLTHARLK
jgi:hypothetical protein